MSYDLLVVRGPNRPIPADVAYASPGLATSGSTAAAQRFIALFLSDRDTVTNRGTDFIPALKRGAIRNDSAVILNFALAVVQVIQELGDQSALPSSEQIVRADLVAHSLFSDKLSLTVKLSTLDGVVEFPIPIEKL